MQYRSNVKKTQLIYDCLMSDDCLKMSKKLSTKLCPKLTPKLASKLFSKLSLKLSTKILPKLSPKLFLELYQKLSTNLYQKFSTEIQNLSLKMYKNCTKSKCSIYPLQKSTISIWVFVILGIYNFGPVQCIQYIYFLSLHTGSSQHLMCLVS